MADIYYRRLSKAASWCLRLAVFALPYFIICILVYRTGILETYQAFWLLFVGIGILITSLLCGVWALVDLWENGYKGGRMTVNGVFLSTLLLIPFAYQFVLAISNPQINDVATDQFEPPVFLQESQIKARGDEYDKYHIRTILNSYPNAVTRSYDATPKRVWLSVEDILKRWEWKLVEGQNIPQKPVAKKEDDEKLEGDENQVKELEDGAEEQGSTDQILVQVQASSLILKTKSNISIRLKFDEEITLVDMRSASNWSPHDFGTNAANIDSFFQELDNLMTGVAGEL
ncbi:MAG: DUF1499 domain-containing protein [Nitratireductor sp.]